MDPSKPPSDIGAPSKASSDIDCPKANSDIGVSTRSVRSQLDYKSKSGAATCESDGNVQQNSAEAEPIVVAYSNSDSVNSKLVNADVEVTGPRVDQARVAAKRGKPARNASSSNALSRSLQNSSGDPRRVGEGKTRRNDKTHRAACSLEKYRLAVSRNDKLHAASQRYRLQHNDNSVNADCVLGAADVSLGRYHAVEDNARDATGRQVLRISRNSQLPLAKSRIRASLRESCQVYRDPDRKIATLAGSKSFRSNARETKQRWCSSEKPRLVLSRSLRSARCWKTSSSLVKSAVYSPELGGLSSTDCHTSPVVSTGSRGVCNTSGQCAEGNLSPPPLSTLQIFAISTKPLDIQMAPVDSDLPGDVDELPSLPMIKHMGNKSEEERKLSILKPPPPDLVSRQESNDNWNRFLVQLNAILEGRAGEFV